MSEEKQTLISMSCPQTKKKTVPKDSIDPSNGHLNVAYALAMGEKALWLEGVGSFLPGLTSCHI